jgi:hypothetical protein
MIEILLIGKTRKFDGTESSNQQEHSTSVSEDLKASEYQKK